MRILIRLLRCLRHTYILTELQGIDEDSCPILIPYNVRYPKYAGELTILPTAYYRPTYGPTIPAAVRTIADGLTTATCLRPSPLRGEDTHSPTYYRPKPTTATWTDVATHLHLYPTLRFWALCAWILCTAPTTTLPYLQSNSS